MLLAASLDYLIGDPWGWPHPVRAMGWVISHFTQLVINHWHRYWEARLAGIGLGFGLIIGSGVVGWLIIRGASWINQGVGVTIECILLASCFAGRSLRAAAVDVLQPLKNGQLEEARTKLSQYVGRDTEKLAEPEILRAVLETVAENATDGVMAPLFYAIVGALLPGVGSVPLALAYKASSTLDSMIGYRKEPYADLGWFSAQLEDL
ncbi:MAG: cobalamin biosynthesis protein CobD, partial [Symploca sp. SIO2C1]|nr:cobalamin biosynthesis protein CobD [Symploca sp. SIO2C1]